ncbi:hypothetical protein F2982_07030 [Rhizobium sp. BG4]|nr:hypothetical protein F2982_07030 [Rhizobium sp. BG4]
MSQGSLSNLLLPEETLAASAKCALILFFIYNKHFQVNGNIVPVDEGGKQPQAIQNNIRIAIDKLPAHRPHHRVRR